MDTVVLNGARVGDIEVDAVSDALSGLLGGLGAVSVFKLRDVAVADCLGCFGCWIKTPGVCVIADEAREIAQKLMHAELTVFLTPVVFGGYSYELKKILDRQICRELPFFKTVNGEIHHKPRYDKHSKLVAIGVLPKPNAQSEEIFKTLVSRNAINMHAPNFSSGIIYESDDPKTVKEKLKRYLLEAGI